MRIRTSQLLLIGTTYAASAACTSREPAPIEANETSRVAAVTAGEPSRSAKGPRLDGARLERAPLPQRNPVEHRELAAPERGDDADAGASAPGTSDAGIPVDRPPGWNGAWCSSTACRYEGTCVEPSSGLSCTCGEEALSACVAVRFQSIGWLPSSYSGWSLLSDDGRTAFGSIWTGQGISIPRPLVWTLTSGVQRLEGVPDGFTGPFGMSADGSVVGYAGDGVAALRRGGELEYVVPPDDSRFGARGLSADGHHVIGGYFPSDRDRSFRWTPGTGSIDLGTTRDDADPQPSAVSADGRVVVGREYVTMYFDSMPYRWTPTRGMQLLPLPQGAVTGSAHDVDASGRVIVGTTFSADAIEQMVRWTGDPELDAAELTVEVIGRLPGATSADAPIVSEDGTVIAGRSDEAVIWTRDAGLRPLRLVLVELGAELDDWFLDRVIDVSADGKTLLGVGTYNGRWQSWIARLP